MEGHPHTHTQPLILAIMSKTVINRILFEPKISFPYDRYPRGQLLGCVVSACLGS